VIAISGALFLTPVRTELWPAVNVAGIVALCFIIALLFYVLRNPIRTRAKVLAALVAAIALAAIAIQWVRMEERTHWQKDQLMRIRGVIGRGVCTVEMTGHLLKTLDLYHRQSTGKPRTIADAFAKVTPGAHLGMNIHKPEWAEDEMTIVVTVMSPDSIVLVSRDLVAQGRDAAFRNYDGAKGMIQEKYILTTRGITHVSEN
jgi:branched-subunit amino acid ABC-type transport system permease component